MNSPVAKKLSVLGLIATTLAVLAVLVFSRGASAACDPTDTSCAKPYFKSTGSDIGTGGWFNANSNNCTTDTHYQDANIPPGAADDRNGGILAFAKESGTNVGVANTGGASDEFAAFALGRIEGDDTNNWGFYSGGAQAKNGANFRSYLTFAATVPWGGLLVPPGPSNPRQTTYCIPDYFAKMPSPQPGGLPSDKLHNNSSGVYYESGNPLTLADSDITILPGNSVTVYVRGSVYINHNVTYAAFDVDHVTKFSLVVLGSIYIDPGVTRLDGLYIAQPDPAAGDQINDDTGIIWTCHDATPNAGPKYDYIAACVNRLQVKGSFIAKQINLLRIKGDVASAPNPAQEDGWSSAWANNNVAEVINFTPDMVIGGPFFNDGSTNNNPKIKSLISLPPVF